ncbi:MAG: bifunctional enoyl-CoA hydratase/phosphate acetyltransferase [Coriobacteriales bacterium]
MAIKTFQEMVDAAKAMSEKTKIVVVNAQDEHTLDAIIEAKKEDIVSPILVGDTAAIEKIIKDNGANPADFEIIQADDTDSAIKKSTDLVKSGDAHVLMKGKLQTAEIMRAIVHDDEMKRGGGMISLVGLYETSGYHKIFAVSDMGMNTYPDLEGKKKILINAVDLLHAMGIENPKVAVLSAVEKLNPKMPDTVDGDALKQMNQKGEITGCIVEGPISFDLAMVPGAAEIKGYESPVSGDADLLIVPDIVCGNVLVKCLTEIAGAATAGIMVGARVPLVITSRSAKPTDKFYSIALAAFVGQNY